MILRCNFEEPGALRNGAHMLLGESSGESLPVAAPPKGREEVEGLLFRLTGDLPMEALVEVETGAAATLDAAATFRFPS
ncbi:MAG: hypothetical protein ABIF09_07525 [Gemmatimonadota bacterium]